MIVKTDCETDGSSAALVTTVGADQEGDASYILQLFSLLSLGSDVRLSSTLLLQQEQHQALAKITVVGGKNTPDSCKNHSVQKSITQLSEKMKCDDKN